MPIEIDRSQWSMSSQRSYGGHYDDRASCYENISYRCKKCSIGCVFTDTEQKFTYEIKKKFIWYIPSLCKSCEISLSNLRIHENEFQKLWNSSRDIKSKDIIFLKNWLNTLREIQTYGKRTNTSVITMLVRLLNDLPA